MATIYNAFFFWLLNRHLMKKLCMINNIDIIRIYLLLFNTTFYTDKPYDKL